MRFFAIDQSETETKVQEVAKEEYDRTRAVLVMTKALEARKMFSYFKGNVVERIMEQFIRDRIPVGYVEKIAISPKFLPHIMCCAGVEVSVDSEKKFWIFDNIVSLELSDDVDDYEIRIIMKG